MDVSGTAITDDGIQLILGASKVFLLVLMSVGVDGIRGVGAVDGQFRGISLAFLRSTRLTHTGARLCPRRWCVLLA